MPQPPSQALEPGPFQSSQRLKQKYYRIPRQDMELCRAPQVTRTGSKSGLEKYIPTSRPANQSMSSKDNKWIGFPICALTCQESCHLFLDEVHSITYINFVFVFLVSSKQKKVQPHARGQIEIPFITNIQRPWASYSHFGLLDRQVELIYQLCHAKQLTLPKNNLKGNKNAICLV